MWLIEDMNVRVLERPNFTLFTFYYLKQKNVTDKNTKKNSAGHKSDTVRQRYHIKPDKNKPAKLFFMLYFEYDSP